MVFSVVKLVTRKSPLHVWDLILFGVVAAMILLFYVYRYNRENRFFARDFKLPWLGNFSAVVLLTLVLTATRISISYLQAYGKIPLYDFQTIYLKSQSTGMFWFLIVVQGIILPILQEFLATGFLFNYAFRRDSVQVAVVGIIVSGLIFSVLIIKVHSLTSLLKQFTACSLLGAIYIHKRFICQSIWQS